MSEQKLDPVRRVVQVSAAVERAFAVFTEELGNWWPPLYTFAGEEGWDTAVIEPETGGRWFERNQAGEETAWGTVLTWDPPHHLILTWRVSPERTQEPPERASRVDVRFTAAGPNSSRVELIHDGFAQHGDGAQTLQQGMASPEGWTKILTAYAAAVG